MGRRGKLMKTLNFSASTAPSSAFGTSPRKKPRGEKDSRLRESQVVHADCEKCALGIASGQRATISRTRGSALVQSLFGAMGGRAGKAVCRAGRTLLWVSAVRPCRSTAD